MYCVDTDTAIEFLKGNPTIKERFLSYKGKIKKELKEGGNIIDNFDLVIASLCLAHRKILVTNNVKHFERLEELKIQNWMK